MTRLARAAVVAAVVLALAYGGYRVYRRSLPPLPAVVLHDAALQPLLAPSLGARLRHAVLGSAADGRVAGPKLIALTFDDGPYPVDTPMLLAVLRAGPRPGDVLPDRPRRRAVSGAGPGDRRRTGTRSPTIPRPTPISRRSTMPA